MTNHYVFKIIVISLFISCEDGSEGEQIEDGAFPDVPVNMAAINSEYDDYNSASPTLGNTSPLCFSSNRWANGKDFDIVYKLLDVHMFRNSGELKVAENTSSNLDVYAANQNINSALIRINTGFDELGPYLIPQGNGRLQVGNSYKSFQNYILMYASNETGNFNIKFTQNVIDNNYSSPRAITFLNSSKDDIYPVLTADSSKLYFCSNRNGDFDIYRTDLNTSDGLLSAISDSTPMIITKESILSSSSDDKCPFIIGNLMVFASNRSGGFGGFDLYYSTFANGKWSVPLNYGDKINTTNDEYRPIVKDYGEEFTNDFMIFSSNRSGGKGGFDLYYVGIKKR